MPSVELPAAGDPIPSNCQVIEVRVAGLPHLFNTIDPTPFNERDLDPRVEEFIVGWVRELPRKTPIALLVHTGRGAAVRPARRDAGPIGLRTGWLTLLARLGR